MNLEKLKMEKQEARELARQYKAEVKSRNRKEDEELRKAYSALARGQELISLRNAMRSGGVNSNGLPNLAICQADAQMCCFRVNSEHATFRRDDKFHWAQPDFRFPLSLLPGLTEQRYTEWKALVPSIPAARARSSRKPARQLRC